MHQHSTSASSLRAHKRLQLRRVTILVLLLLGKMTLIGIHAYLLLINTYHTQSVTYTFFQQLGVFRGRKD